MKRLYVIIQVVVSGICLQPLVAAAQGAPGPRSNEARLDATLDRIQDYLGALERQPVGLKEKNELSSLRNELEAADRQAMEDYASIEKLLRHHQLPEPILARHRNAVKAYQAEMAKLRSNLNALDKATGGGRARQAKAHLAAVEARTRRPTFDPRKPAMRVLKANKANLPRLQPGEYRAAGLPDVPAAGSAATGDVATSALPDASNPAYLAETPEVILSDTIRAKAAQLSHDPVKIFNWIYNNIEWLPSWGAVQGSDLTLGSRRGNAFDSAGLLIALLRASNVPARYAHGTVEFDAATFRALAGHFTDAGAAIDLASAAGLPATAVVSGGHITKVRFEHVWVEAAIDFFPSRGAINRTPDQWVALDPCIKTVKRIATPDYLALGDVQPTAAIAAFAGSGTIDPQAGWLQGLDPRVLDQGVTPAADAANQAAAAGRGSLEHYGDSGGARLSQIVGGAKVMPTAEPGLPSSQPYRVLTVGARYAQVPSQLQGKVTFAFLTNPTAESVSPVTLPLARVNGRKMTLSYVFASQADHDAYAALLPEGPMTELSQLPSSIPAYLISVVPQLRLGQEVISTGTPTKLGEAMSLEHAMTIPGVWSTASRTARVIAGAHLGVLVVAGSVNGRTFARLSDRFEAADNVLDGGTIDDIVQYAPNFLNEVTSDAFYAGLLEYFAKRFTVMDLVTKGSGLGSFQLISGMATFGYRPAPRYFFGVPRALELGALGFDAPELLYSVQSSTGDAGVTRAITHQLGTFGSSLEGDVPASLWTVGSEPPPASASATNNLRAALEGGQRIYRITQANRGAISQLAAPAEVKDDVGAAVDAGLEVIIHQSPIVIPGRAGAISTVGYVVLDPVTGAGQYLLDNGTNGGLTNTANEMMADCAYVNRPGFVNNDVDWARHEIVRKCADFARVLNDEVVETRRGLMEGKVEAAMNFMEVYAKMPIVIVDCMMAGAPLVLGELLVAIQTAAAMLAIQAADLRSVAVAEWLNERSEDLQDLVGEIHGACIGEDSDLFD